MRLADRLRGLDERLVWAADRPAAPRLGPAGALVIGLLGLSVYVGWSLAWGWPRAAVATVVLGVLLGAAARFWFAPAAPPPVRRDRGVDPGQTP